MKYISIRPKFKIRINYKSGISHDVWAWKFVFKQTSHGKECSWIIPAPYQPLHLNLEDVESVWQTGVKRWCLCTSDSKVFK